MKSELALRRHLIKLGIDPDGPADVINDRMKAERAKLISRFERELARARGA